MWAVEGIQLWGGLGAGLSWVTGMSQFLRKGSWSGSSAFLAHNCNIYYFLSQRGEKQKTTPCDMPNSPITHDPLTIFTEILGISLALYSSWTQRIRTGLYLPLKHMSICHYVIRLGGGTKLPNKLSVVCLVFHSWHLSVLCLALAFDYFLKMSATVFHPPVVSDLGELV